MSGSTNACPRCGKLGTHVCYLPGEVVAVNVHDRVAALLAEIARLTRERDEARAGGASWAANAEHFRAEVARLTRERDRLREAAWAVVEEADGWERQAPAMRTLRIALGEDLCPHCHGEGLVVSDDPDAPGSVRCRCQP